MESDTKGTKIRARESINRIQSLNEDFVSVQKIYKEFAQVTKSQIEFNIGHDDSEVHAGFQKLIKLFEENNLAKSFLVTDFGAIERYLLCSLQNIDENVMLYACKCIETLIKGRGGTGHYDEGA